jgi:hypothetical protein
LLAALLYFSVAHALVLGGSLIGGHAES